MDPARSADGGDHQTRSRGRGRRMSQVPSIKGSIFARGVEDLGKLVSDGRLSREEVARRLEPGEDAHLGEAVLPTAWYDVRTYGRILDLLRDVEGNGDNRYLVERGARSAELLLSAGLYQQLEYLDRTRVAAATSPEERYRAFGLDLRLLTSLHRTIVNFGTQTARPDPLSDDRYVIEIADVAVYPEPLCWTTDGFINRLAEQHHEDSLWVWSRPQPDLIVFRMTRPP